MGFANESGLDRAEYSWEEMMELDTTDKHPEPRGPLYRRWWLGTFGLLALLIVGFAIFVANRFHRVMAERPAQFKADIAAMQQPENLEAAGLFLARLMQSDPALWKSDDNDFPDWLPPELGKFHLRDFSMTAKGCTMSWGGGGDDILGIAGYSLEADSSSSTQIRAGYVLTCDCGPPAGSNGAAVSKKFRFSILRTDRIDEDELVQRGLKEIARRQAAYAAGTEFNVYGDDPAAERQRLLAQHPAIAAKLSGKLPATDPIGH